MMAGESKGNGSSAPLQDGGKGRSKLRSPVERRRNFPRRFFKLHIGSVRRSEHPPLVRSAAMGRRPQPSRLSALAELLRQVAAALLILAVAGVVGGSVHRQLWEAAQLNDYRSTIREVCDAVRLMRWRSASGHRMLELYIDAPRRSFQVVTFEGQSQVVERTIWLPAGLEILEAPERLATDRAGRLPEASIVLSAPSQNRLFRVTTTGRGFVQCHEESIL